jgi:hypothetical protein
MPRLPPLLAPLRAIVPAPASATGKRQLSGVAASGRMANSIRSTQLLLQGGSLEEKIARQRMRAQSQRRFFAHL